MIALHSMLKVEKILRRIKSASQRKRPPKGGYRPLLSEIRRLLGQAEAALEKSQERERKTKKKWITIACELCLRPLARVDPKGPIAIQRTTRSFFCWRCDDSEWLKGERRHNVED